MSLKLLLVLLIATCCPIVAYSQDDYVDDLYARPERKVKVVEQKEIVRGNYKAINGEVIWQKVFDAEDSSAVISYFTQAANFTVITDEGSKLTISRRKQAFDPGKFGYSDINFTLPPVLEFPIAIDFVLQLRGPQYRITVIRCDFYPDVDITVGKSTGWGSYVSGSTNSNTVYSLTELIFNAKRNKFKQEVTSSVAKILDTFLISTFTIPIQQKVDDWN